MRRPCFRKPALTLSMFPFLAVLVCTMGALIVLLVMVVQKAKFEVQVESAQRAEVRSSPAAPDESLQSEKEIHEWRTNVLAQQRDELRQQATERRLALSHLEDHIRRLETRWRELTVQAKELSQLGESKQQTSLASAEEVEKLRRDIEQARQEIKAAKEKVASRPPTFAIVPYEGPNGTKRRPIYIECTDHGIVLQPNGITLRPQDFEEAMGPGNPLDAALRTTREYLAKHGDTAVHGEPYPLLIVRPNGTVAYAVARAAIKSWDDEFGYELIDGEMQLAFPPPDPALHRELDRAIADARSRQTILAMAMPGRFKRGNSSGLVATSHGGFRSAGSAGESSAVGASYAGGTAGSGSFSSAFRQASSSANSSGAALAMPGTKTISAPSKNLGPAGSAISNGAGSATVSPGKIQSAPQGTGTLATAPGQKLSPSGQSKRPPGMAGGGSSGKGKTAPAGYQPLAAARGENWGLPNRSPTATGFTRYIQVQCSPDRLLVMPEKGDYQGPAVVQMTEDTSSAVDPLVAAIWKRMESWGIAAESGYWKPIVRVQVAPGAEVRFQELQSLLAGSGLTVERK